MREMTTQAYLVLVVLFAIISSLECGHSEEGKRKVLGSCGLPVTPVTVFPFDDEFGGEEAIHHNIKATLSQVDGIAGPSGKQNGGLMLRGSYKSYIEIPNSDRGKLDISKSITILAFIYPITANLGPVLNYKPDGHGVQIWTNGKSNGKGVLTARFNKRNLALSQFVSKNVLNLNEWNFIGASYDYNTEMASLWHDGQEVLSTKLRSSYKIELATQFSIRLGALTVSGLGAYEGGISCLQLYDTVLTREQIEAARQACTSASPVTSLSVNTVPPSLKVEIDQTLSVSGFTQNRGKDGIFTFNFGDGTPKHTATGNTAVHAYRKAGEFTIVVIVTDRCKLGTPIQKDFKIAVTYVATKLYGLALKAQPTETRQQATLTLTFPVESIFNCSVEFGDGGKDFMVNPRFKPVKTTDITHQYAIYGFYNVLAVCWNRINSCNATTMISIQDKIQGLNVVQPHASRNGTHIKVRWQVTKGSNIEYKAMVNSDTEITVSKSSQTQGRATIAPKDYGSVGRHSVTITASNDVTSPISVTRRFEVMYPVSPFRVTVVNTTGYFMVKKPVNLTINPVNLNKGIISQYSIDFADGSPRLITNMSVVPHTYIRHGCYVINVTSFNPVSSLSVNRSVCVEREMELLKGLSVYSSPAKVNDTVLILLHLNNGSHFSCAVHFSDGTEVPTGKQQTLKIRVTHRFVKPGIYDVIARCWNKVSSANTATRIFVQYVIESFVLYPIHPVTYGQNITIKWSITQGTNVTYNVTFMSRNIAYITDENINSTVITSDDYDDEGLYDVTVTAKNSVTQPITLKQQFVIEKPIFGVNLTLMYIKNDTQLEGLGKMKTYFPVGYPVVGRTSLESQTKYVHYTYRLNGVTMETWTNKNTLSLPALDIGIYSISVTAVNNVSRVHRMTQILFQKRVKFLDRTLLCSSPVVIGDKARIRFSIGSVASDTCLLVHVINDTIYYYNRECNQFITSSSSESLVHMQTSRSYVDFYHVFKHAGKNLIQVSLVNLVSKDTLTCDVKVLLIACTYPIITLLQIGTTWSNPRVAKRSESLEISSETNVFCPASEGTVFDWKIYNIDKTTNKSHYLNNTSPNQGSNLPSFHIEKRSLRFGLYRVSLTVRMSEPSLQEYYSQSSGYVEVIPSDLMAKVEGGSSIRRGMGPDVKVDGSSSYDPDVGLNDLTGLTFVWLCRKASASFPKEYTNLKSSFSVPGLLATKVDNSGACYSTGSYIIAHDSPTFLLKTSQLAISQYVVQLVIWKGNRVSTADQTVEVVEGEPPSVDIRCAENCREKVNPSERLSLLAECNGAGCWGKLFYEWTLYINQANTWVVRPYNNSQATSIPGSPITIIGQNTVEGGRQYKIEVTAKRSVGPKGLATNVFQVNSPPYGGKCDVSPRVGHVLMTKFNFRCSDWKDPDEPLSYNVLFSSAGGPQTLLYYGARAGIHEGLPLGEAASNYTMDIEIRISDRLGAKANVFLIVESRPPHQDSSQVMDEISSMTSGNNSLLDSLRKSGQSQGVTLTVSTISSLLNTQNDTKGPSDQELQKKSQVRGKLIASLSEIKSRNIDSLVQVTSAMSRATKVKQEIDPQSQVVSANTLSNVGQMFGGTHDDHDDVGFDSMKSNANSYFSALDNVLGMVASTAGAEQAVIKPNSTTPTISKEQTKKAKDSTKSLVGSMSNVAKTILKRKLPQEQATTFVTPGMRASLKRVSLDEMNNDDLSLGGDGTFTASIGQDLKNMKLVDGNSSLNQEAFTFNENIYSWDKTSKDVSSEVFSLSYSVDGKNMDINGLSSPIQFFMKRKQALPQVQTFNLRIDGNKMNYHRIVIPSNDDSLSIEAFSLNCSYSLYVTVRKDTRPTLDEYSWIKTIKPSNYTQHLSNCSYTENETVLFLSNKNLSSGVYFVGVATNTTSSTSNTTLQYAMRVYASKCLYWSDKDEKWKGDGCTGGPLTNSTHVECLATHLTAFGSGMFVAPNPIDFSQVFAGFKEAFQTGNVVVLFTVLGLFLVYALVAIWARRTDKNDSTEMTSILLPAMKESFKYTYEITIVTGSRRYAGTTANVFCDIHGETGTTGAYPLLVPKKVAFPRRSIRTFIISTPGTIGPITGIRIWHDCSGKHASWFLRKILLRDSQTNDEWVFAADVWIGLDVGDGEVVRFLKPNTLDDLSEFNVMFNDKIRKEICDKHIWFSLVLRPQWSPFTRLQRLSCCLSFLFTTMIASAMFYGAGPQPGDTSGNFQVGPLIMNIQTIFIAIQSALVVVPVNVIVVAAFRFAEPMPEEEEEGAEKESKIKRCAPSCTCPCRDDTEHDFEEGVAASEKKGNAAESTKVRKNSSKSTKTREDSSEMNNEAKEKVHSNTDDPSDNEDKRDDEEAEVDGATPEPPEEQDHCETDEEQDDKCCSSFKLPYWFIYVGWFLCITASFLSALFTIFYSMMWGKEKSNLWLATMTVSFVQDILISQPIKVLLTALLFALIVRRAREEEGYKPKKIETIPPEYYPNYNDDDYEDEVAPLDKRVTNKLRKQREKLAEIKGVMVDICYYVMILILVSILGQQYRSGHTYHLKKTMQNMFVNPAAGLGRIGTADIQYVKAVGEWINHTLIGGLTDERDRNYNTGLNNEGLRVLHSRLRQLRLTPGDCKTFSLECKVYYSKEQEDDGFYDIHWKKLKGARNQESPWQYKTSEEANHSLSVSGIYTDYIGGGYTANLKNHTAGSRAVVNQLVKDWWVDKFTRAIFAEFDVYSANTDLITAVTVLFEMPSYGGIVTSVRVVSFSMPQSDESLLTSVVEGIAFLFLTVMIFRVIMVLFLQRCKFFTKLHNIFDILFVMVSVCVTILRMLMTNAQAAQRSYYLESPTSFIDFHKCAGFSEILNSTFAFMFFIAVARFSCFITLFSCIQEFIGTVKRSLEQLGNFIIILMLLICAYASLFVLAFAAQLADFRNFSVATRTLFSFILSNLSGRELPEPKALALPMICSYSLTMIFLMLNIFRAILGENHKMARDLARQEKNDFTDVAKYMLCVLQEMLTDNNSSLLEPQRQEKSDSERRLLSQTKYVTNNQSLRINKYLNDLYTEDFYEDLFILRYSDGKTKTRLPNHDL